MPLTVIEQPPRFVSAYKPMLIGVTSTKSPNNTTPFESGIPISTIKEADSTDVTTYGAPLEVGDVFVVHTSVTVTVLPIGQTLKISACDITDYDGVHRVTKVISDTVLVIDSEPFGEAITGLLEKHYENFTVYARCTLQDGRQRTYDISADSDGTFYLDPSDFIRSTFNDVFTIANATDAFALIDAETYITMGYYVNCFEAYNVPDDDGINVYTEQEKDGDVANVLNKIAVNSVQPYHHINEGTGAIDYLWDEDMEPYETADDGGTYRFLSYHPGTSTYNVDTAHRCAYTDPVWLAFLWADTTNTDIRYRLNYFNVNGSNTTVFGDLTANKKSYLFNAGAEAIGVPDTALRYSVAIYRNNTELIPPVWFTIDETCQAGTRFYLFNRFGAIDQYTVDGGKVSRSMEVDRLVTTKNYIAKTLGVGGDYNRRTYATAVTASYEQDTRTERKEKARWILDELLTSPDVRLQIYNGDSPAYTHVILDTDKGDAGIRGQRYRMRWSLGVDNVRARR